MWFWSAGGIFGSSCGDCLGLDFVRELVCLCYWLCGYVCELIPREVILGTRSWIVTFGGGLGCKAWIKIGEVALAVHSLFMPVQRLEGTCSDDVC